MKKHKHVVAILLSVMMVFTFMPTLAFAQTVEDGHDWDDGTVTKKASSCYDYTLTEYKCKGEDVNHDHLDCGAAYTAIEWKGHDFGTTAKPNMKNVTTADFLAQVKAQDPEDYADWYTSLKENTVCYVRVPVCKNCGIFDLEYLGDPEDVAYDLYYGSDLFFTHEKVKGTPSCAATYKCKYCGVIYDNPDYSNDPDDHNCDDFEYQSTFCSAVDITDDKYAGGYSVWTTKCKDCGEVFYDTDLNKTEEEVEHTGLGKAVTPKAGEEAYYVQYEGKYYEPTKVLVSPKCADPGLAELRCSKCGTLIGTCQVAPTGHEFETVTIPATCEFEGATLVACKVCGERREYTRGDAPLGHNYKITVLAEPNCFADGITIAECERCNGFAEISDEEFDNVDRDLTTQKVYFTGFNDELKKTATADNRIEIAEWLHKDHDWGKYEDMTEATCENGVLQARKCAVDGLYDVHNTLETGQPKGHDYQTITQAPTCGADGFSIDVCKVCNDSANYKKGDKPVVSYGTKCTFDKWVVETKATPFKEGTKKLVCSVCNDDGHLYMVNVAGEYSVKEGNVTRRDIAKTKIAAPKVKAGKKKATVTVKAVEGAVKYQIKVNGKVKKTVKKAGKVTIKKLAGGKKAKFQIVAFDAEGTKAASKTKIVKIKK